MLALCETNLDDSFDFSNISVRGYLSLIWKNSTSHMHGLAVYVKEGLPFPWEKLWKETRKLVNYNYNFSISNNLTQMVNFPTWMPDCDSHSPAPLDLLPSFDASICSTMAFAPIGNSDHVISVPINFLSNSQQDAVFHCIAYDYSHADWDGLHDHLRDVPWEDIFKLRVLLLVLLNFLSGFRLELM